MRLPSTDCAVHTTRYAASAEKLRDLMIEHGLVDISCEKWNRVQFTHFQPTSGALLHRINITSERHSDVYNYLVKPIFHEPVHGLGIHRAIKKSHGHRFKRELWKLNSSLLSDENFQHGVSACLHSTLERNDLSIFRKWDLSKQEIRKLAVEACARVAFLKRHHFDELGRILTRLHELEITELRAHSDAISNVKAEMLHFIREKYWVL